MSLQLLFFWFLNGHQGGAAVSAQKPNGILYLVPLPSALKPLQVAPNFPPLKRPSNVAKFEANTSVKKAAAAHVMPASQETTPAEKPSQQALTVHQQEPAALDLSEGVLWRAAKAARYGSFGGLADAAGVEQDPASGPAQVLTEGVKRSARLDCRTAHAGKGLLALPFLLADTITDKGCKW